MKVHNSYRLYNGAWVFDGEPHKEIKLKNCEISKILSKGGFVLRNTYDFDISGQTSFWYVIKDSFGGYDELSAKTRNQVKRCFKTMEVKPISSDLLLAYGYDVYGSAFENYKLKMSYPTEAEFKKRVMDGEDNEYWGVFDIETKRLVAFSMNRVTEESCEYSTMKAIPEYRKKYAYYGLIFEMNRYYLEEKGLKYVNDGSRSITNHSDIQSFLIGKFNFRKAYCRLQVYYRWWFKILVNCLYPFRSIIPIKKIRYLLDMEAMARNMI